MKIILAVIALLISNFAQAKSYNCEWQASTGGGNLNAEDVISNFDSCSLIIRGMLLGFSTPKPTNIMQAGVGAELHGTLTFVRTDGSKVECETVPNSKNVERWTGNDGLMSYLEGELTGASLSTKDRMAAQKAISEDSDMSAAALKQKLDRMLPLICATPSV